MNSDDKIREILRMEADTVEPSAAGWEAIRQGIARRSARAWWTRGTALAGAAAVFLGGIAYVAVDRSRHGVEGVTSPPGPSVSFTSTPSGEPTASPAVSPPAPPRRADEPIGAIWPLTTYGEVAAWERDPETYPALKTSRGSALAFMRRYLGITDAVISGEEAYGESTLVVKRGPVTLSTLSVKGYGKDGTAPFVVTQAKGWEIGFWTPRPAAALNGRFDVRGGAFEGVDSPIDVTLRVDGAGADPTLGEVVARAERTPDGWAVTMDAAGRTGTGSLLATVRSDDGSQVTSAEAIPVTFGAVPGPPVIVAARGGRIAVIEKETGRVERWLTEPVPGAGAYDPELSEDGKTVVYAQATGACSSEIRSVPFAGGAPKTLVPGDKGRLSQPTLHGDLLAYVGTACQRGGDQEFLVILENGTQLVEPWQGDVLSGPVATGRYVVFVGAKDGGAPRVWVLDGGNEIEPRSAAAAAGCSYVTATWGLPESGGGTAVYAAVDCGGRTYLERLSHDLSNAERLQELRVSGVDHLDFAGPDLLVGADGAAYVADEHDEPFRVPGEAQRPTWS